MSLDFLINKMYEDGFIYTDVKPKIGKGQLLKLLKNPFYTGQFLYKGALYNGRHEALISVNMFNNAARGFKKDNKPDKQVKHPIQRLFKCAHCGSAVVGEIKKNKYIYYHCGDKTKACPNKKINLRQADIDKVFDEAIKRIQITQAHKQAIITALKAAHGEEGKYNEAEIKRLENRAETIRSRLSKIYLDKLDGVITQDFLQEKHNEWTLEHAKFDFEEEKIYSP